MKLFQWSFASLPLNLSRRVVFSYERKYMHEVLVNCLFKLAQEKVWLGELTVPPAMTTQTNKQKRFDLVLCARQDARAKQIHENHSAAIYTILSSDLVHFVRIPLFFDVWQLKSVNATS